MDNPIRPPVAPQAPITLQNQRIVVAAHSFSDFYTTPHRLSALGASTVARICRESGWETHFYNFPASKRSGKPQALPPQLGYLKPFILENESSPVSWFSRYMRFGPSAAVCASRIAALEPQLCLISCFAFCYADHAVELARCVRALLPSTFILIGGAGATALPRWFFKEPAVDAVCQGEAEPALAPFLERLFNGDSRYGDIPNIWIRSGGQIVAPASIVRAKAEQLVAQLVPTLTTSRVRYRAVSLSRGCSQRCRFCANRFVHGDTFRQSTGEIRILPPTLTPECTGRIEHIVLEDDNLTLGQAHFFASLDSIAQSVGPIRFQFENGVDHRHLDTQLLEQLHSRGLAMLNVSMASFRPSAPDHPSRLSDLARYQSILSWAYDKQLPVVTYFIAGLEGDSIDSIARTMLFLAKLPTRVGISPFYAVPGLPGFDNPATFDSISPRLCAGSSLYPWNNSLTTAQLHSAFRLCRFINLLKTAWQSGPHADLVTTTLELRVLTTRRIINGVPELVPVPERCQELEQPVLSGLNAALNSITPLPLNP